MRSTLAPLLFLLSAAVGCGGGNDGAGGGTTGGSGGSGADNVGPACDAPIDVTADWASGTPIHVPFTFDHAGTAVPAGCEQGTDPPSSRPAVAFRWTANVTHPSDFEVGVVEAPGSDRLLFAFADTSCEQPSSCGWGGHGGLLPALYVSIEAGKTYSFIVFSKDATAPTGSFTLRLGN